MPFEQNGIVIVKRFGEKHFVTKTADEFLKLDDRRGQQSQSTTHLSWSQSGFHGHFFSCGISLERPKFGWLSIRHFIHIKTRAIGIVQDVKQYMYVARSMYR